ncbi:MAG: hypothetical protein IPG89_17040 [Bacteroidetes bacterium]|nr:hypothetical protein [Bacteroidota bacterium]
MRFDKILFDIEIGIDKLYTATTLSICFTTSFYIFKDVSGTAPITKGIRTGNKPARSFLQPYQLNLPVI